MNTNRHKVFVSYHHENDQMYREEFERLFNFTHNIMVSKSVNFGEIDTNLPTDRIRQIIRDDYLRDTTVTIVLIGAETWKRKHVDWEISSSIRDTRYNSRTGLIGILLPSHPDYRKISYNKCIIPPRLHDNVISGFAKIHNWTTNPQEVKNWIHEAFMNRNRINPNNSFINYVNNRNGYGWC